MITILAEILSIRIAEYEFTLEESELVIERRSRLETYGHVVGPMIESKGYIDNPTLSTVGERFQKIIRVLVNHRCVRHQAGKKDQNFYHISREQ